MRCEVATFGPALGGSVWMELSRLAALVVGVPLLYVALFMYQDQRGRACNKLFDWWFRVEDTGERAVGKHAGFVAGVAKSVLRLEWLFGPSSLSVRGAWTAMMLSSASFVVFATMVLAFCFAVAKVDSEFSRKVLDKSPNLPNIIPLFPQAAAMLCAQLIGCVALASAPAVIKEKLASYRRHKSTLDGQSEATSHDVSLPAGFLTWRLLVGGLLAADALKWHVLVIYACVRLASHGRSEAIMMVAGALMIGALSSLALLRVVRYALRQCANTKTTVSGSLWLAATIVGGIGVSMAPMFLIVRMLRSGELAALGLATQDVSHQAPPARVLAAFAAVPLNMLDMAFAFGLAALVVTLLVHRLLWQLASHPIELAYRVFPNNKIIGGVGLGLTLYGAGLGADTVKTLLSALLG
jgi:hypothetical protein